MGNTTEPRDLVGQTVRAVKALKEVVDEFTDTFENFIAFDWFDSREKAVKALDRLTILCGKLERAVEVLSPALKSYVDVVTEFVKSVRRNYDICCERGNNSHTFALKCEHKFAEAALKSQIERSYDGIKGDVLDKLCTNVYYIDDWYELPEEIVWNWEDYNW